MHCFSTVLSIYIFFKSPVFLCFLLCYSVLKDLDSTVSYIMCFLSSVFHGLSLSHFTFNSWEFILAYVQMNSSFDFFNSQVSFFLPPSIFDSYSSILAYVHASNACLACMYIPSSELSVLLR